jgi:hypothetical protein
VEIRGGLSDRALSPFQNQQLQTLLEILPNLEEIVGDNLIRLKDIDVSYLMRANHKLKKITVLVEEKIYRDFYNEQENVRRNLEQNTGVRYKILVKEENLWINRKY